MTMTMTNQTKKTGQDRILDKIKKCLKLSASSNANEAATALRQAQAMMAEYNITQAGHFGGRSATLNRGMGGDAAQTALEHQTH